MLDVNTLFLILYLFIYLFIYTKYSSLVVIFFYLFYGYLSMIVSVYYLDTGDIFAFEVAQDSYKSNSVIVLGTFYLTTLIMYLFLFKKKFTKKLYQNYKLNKFKNRFYLTSNFIKGFLLFAFLYILLIYIHLIYSGIPIFLGYGKGQFWEYAKLPIFNILHNQTSTILLILGFMYSYINNYKKKEKKYIQLSIYFKIILYIYLIYIVLMGYKFGGPLLYIFSFYLTSLIYYSIHNRFTVPQLIKYFTIFASLIIPIIIYVYYFILNFGDGAWQLLFDRIFALQGQVWHYIYNEIDNGVLTANFNHLNIEIENALFSNHHEQSGINYLMQYILPENRLKSYLDGGVRLSGGYPANLFMIFDNIFVLYIIHLFFSYIIFIFHFNFFYHMLRLNLFKTILWFKLAFLSEGFLFMGDFNTLVSKRTLFYLSLLLLIKIIEQSSKYNKRRKIII